MTTIDISAINNYIGKRSVIGYTEDMIDNICMECKKGAKTSSDYLNNLSKKLSNDALKWAVEKSLIKFMLIVVQRLNKISESYGITIQRTYYNILVKTLPTLQSDKMLEMIIKYTEPFWYCIDERNLNHFKDNTVRKHIGKAPEILQEMLSSFISLIEKEVHTGGAVKPEHLESVWNDLGVIVSYCRFYKGIE